METLIRHFRDLTKATFARYGFAYADLLAQWPEVVGRELAGQCRPERIRWPRGPAESGRKCGGVLVIRAQAGHAIELQHETPRIIERINGFYGYGAISSLKIVQDAALPAPREDRKGRTDSAPPASGLPRSHEPEDLESALARLGRGIGAALPAASTLNSPATSSNQDES